VAPRSLLAACLWLAALPALGQGVEFVRPAAGTTLAAGDEIEVRWSGAPGEAAEMELLLSLDGGQSFPVRLTRDLPGDATTYLWRVPGLPAEAAQLALRVNAGGREIVVGRSAPFGIAAAGEPAAFSGSLRSIRGELWWLERAEAGGEGDDPVPAGLDPPVETRFLPAADEPMLADLQSPGGAPRPAVSPALGPLLVPASSGLDSTRTPRRTPRIAPLRI